MKPFILVIFLLFGTTTYSQNVLDNQLEKYSKSVLDDLLKRYDNKIRGYDLDTFDVIVIPSLLYTYSNENIGQYEINTSKWELLGVSKTSKDTIWLHANSVHETGIGESRKKISPGMYNLLYNSKHCFYIYCIRQESNFQKLLGVMNNDKIDIFDYKLNHYLNMKEAINFYWGSIEKLMELQDFEDFKGLFSNSTSIEQAKYILRNSYSDCYRLYPEDTLFVLSTYLNELELKINLYEGQKDFLKRLILKNIKNKDHDSIKNPEYDYFMDNFVSWDLLTTLTKDQFYELKKNDYYYDQKVKISRSILRNYLINQQKRPSEEFDDFLRKEVFKK